MGMYKVSSKIKTSNNEMYKVINNNDNKMYVLKRIKLKKIIDNKMFPQYMLNNLHNRYIINYEDTYEDNEYMNIIMEYYPLDLFDGISKLNNIQEVKHIFYQLVLGVEYLHQQNIIHMDIKPENILLTKQQGVKITDFDLSKIVRSHNKLIYNFGGTYEYIPYEGYSGEGINYKYDIYSLGVVLYEMLTKRKAYNFTNDETEENIYRLAYLKSENKLMTKYDEETLEEDAIDLVKQMTVYPARKRLEWIEIKNHKWLKDINPRNY